ncbi:DUF2285 domain-containing protein [Henriciella sp.]|uniref:DNA -binding domain-containing protein n=1 Tax=Henriciella sp. TaxID=1968823 RepID=UPI0026045C63|nr:DUF2285 domain-containing protein [Henriciella sp.]
MKTYTLKSDGVLKRYDYLWRLTPDRWAWEYLRRNRDFRTDCVGRMDESIAERPAPCADIRLLRSRVPQTLAERWGLVFLPDPNRNGFDADAVWTNGAFPDQVEVHCGPRAQNESCDIFDRTMAICDVTHVTDAVGREFLLIRGKGCVVQVRCTGMSLLGLEPVRMKLTISDVEGYERRVKLQKAALELYGDGPDLATPLWNKTTQVLRNGLIALDCLNLGMTRREIAVVLHGPDRVRDEWDGPSMRHAIRYLVKKAEALRDGGYLTELLGAQLAPNQAVA